MSDQVAAAGRIAASRGVFHEPSANGEIAPPPSAPLPDIPAMPTSFVPPAPEEHDRPDAALGAEAIT